MSTREKDEHRWSEWMARAQRGDAASYGMLLKELAPVIRAFISSRFGALPFVEDCVQECLLTLHQARHTYDCGRPFRPWLFAIVTHRTIDLLRRRPDSEMPLQDAEEPVDSNDAISSLEGTQLLDRLLKRLSAKQRDAIVLNKLQGLTTRECATRLGVSETVIKLRIFRGLRRLRSLADSTGR